MLAGSLSASLSLLAISVPWRTVSAAYVLPLEFLPSTRSGDSGTRGLRHTADLNVTGGIDVGYFYTRIQLGTPPQSFSVIVDTGSSLTYVPCDMCEHCGTRHDDSPFETMLSSTYEEVTCQDQHCGLVCTRNCCKDGDSCQYRRAYTEGSSVSGNLIQDSLWLKPPSNPMTIVVDPESDAPDTPKRRTILSSSRKLQQSAGDTLVPSEVSSHGGIGAPILFGCVTDERGQIYRQKADGILGLADEKLSVPRQLQGSGAITDTFSLCYGSHSGALILGDVHPDVLTALPPPITTPRSRLAPFYNVQISGIAFGEQQLDIDLAPFEKSYGTIIDSGTTFTYLPSDAYQALAQAFVASVEGIGLSVMMEESVGTYCFVAPDLQSHHDLAGALPTLTFFLGAQQTPLELRPKSYLFNQLFLNGKDSAWCLGMLDGGATSATIGAITLRDVVVTMDNKNREVHFRPVPSCNDFAGAVTAAESGATKIGARATATAAAAGAAVAAQSPLAKDTEAADAPEQGEDGADSRKGQSVKKPKTKPKAEPEEPVDTEPEPPVSDATAKAKPSTASDTATEAPMATAVTPLPQSSSEQRTKQPKQAAAAPSEDRVGRKQRLYVALGGVGGILVLVAAALAYWRFCGGGRSGNNVDWDYTELVEHKKLLEGSKFGRPSDASKQCELAAWHNGDFDDWTMEDGGLGVSPFSLGEPCSSEQGHWASYDASRASRVLNAPNTSTSGDTSGALSTVHVRHDGSRQPYES